MSQRRSFEVRCATSRASGSATVCAARRGRPRSIGSSPRTVRCYRVDDARWYRRHLMKGWTVARVFRGLRRHAAEALLDALVVALAYLLATGIRIGGLFETRADAYAVPVALGAGALQVATNI